MYAHVAYLCSVAYRTRIPVRQNVPVAALEVEEEGDDDAAAVVKKEENSALVAAMKAEPKEAERGDVGVKREKGSGAATSKVKKKGSGDAVTDDKRPSAPRITKRERRREDCKDKAVKVEVGSGKRGGGEETWRFESSSTGQSVRKCLHRTRDN